MASIGYAAMPVIPSFAGISQQLQREVGGPLEKMSLKFGKSVEKGIGDGAAKAAERVEKANFRVKKSSEELTEAESKYRAEKLKQEAADKALESAAKKLADARAKGGDAAEKAEEQYLRAQAKAETASNNSRKAHNKLLDAQEESARAAKRLADAEEQAAKGADESAKSLRGAGDAAGYAAEQSKLLEDWQLKAAAGAAAIVGGAVAVGKSLVDMGSQFDDAYDTIRAGTGASGEAFEDLQDSMRKVAAESIGVGSDMGAIGSTLADLNTRLGLTGEPLEEMTAQFLQLQQLGVDADINEVSQALNGFGIEAKDMPAALDELFQVSQATGLTITELSQSAVKAGPVLRGFGFSMADSAALVGQMDKAGLDADKTLQSMQRALAEFASEGRDAPAALKETIRSIEDLVQSGDDAAAIDMASGIFGTRGAAQFVDAVKTGTLSVEDFMDATGATEDTIGGLAEETADFAERWDQFKLQAMLALEPVAMALFDSIAPALDVVAGKFEVVSAWLVDDLIPSFKAFGEWAQKNQAWLAPLAVTLGTFAGAIAATVGAIKAWNAAVGVYQAVTKIATAETKLFNLALKTNVIVAIVSAVAALAAGLVYFFTQTEKGREIWEKLTGSLKSFGEAAFNAVGAGLEWVKEKWDSFTNALTTAWDSYIKPVFDGMLKAAQATIGVIATVVLAPLMIQWELLSTAIQFAWDNVIKPVWEALVSFAQNTMQPIVEGVFSWIGDRWQAMATAIGEVWDWLKDVMLAGWEFINTYVFQPWRDALGLLADFFRSRFEAMIDVWDWFQALLRAGWEFIEGNVFAPLGKGLDTLQDWFSKGVDGIGRIWDGLRAVAAKPVKFVIDTVWNNGILKAWNAIADFLPGIDTVNKVDLGQLGGYAQGGVLPGYTPGRDVHDFYSPTGGMIHLSGGEAIMRPEWTRAVGGKKTVDRMNAMAKAGKLDKDQMAIGLSHGTLGAFANGGVIGAMANIVRAKYPMLQLTSGYRPGDSGMHGAGLASDWSNGHGNTPQQLALAHDIAQTYPGSAELIYDSPGWAGNIKNGQNVGPFGSFYTMAQAGPHHHHVHWAMTTAPNIQFGGGVFEGGSNGGPGGPLGGLFNWIADKARGIWSKIVDPIKGKIDGVREDSKFWDIPFGFLETIKEKTWSFLSSKFGSGGGVNSGSVDTSDVSGAVAEQVETVFARHGFTGADWEATKWIIGKESGWNPTATNPSSGAYGLFQFNPMGGNTLGSYLPDRNPDPAVQADAGARYIKDRYGSPTAAKAFWERNGWYASGGVIELPKLYDQGGWLEHGKSAVNLSGKPEPVFTAAQWSSLSAMIRTMGDLVPAIKGQTEAIADAVESTEKWMAKAANPTSLEGIAARSFASKSADIMGMLGLDNTSSTLSAFLAAENDFVTAQEGYTARMETIAEKTKALKKAQDELAELQSGKVEMSTQDKRKLADAEKALAEARAEAGQAAGGSVSATRKVADAEKALADARKSGDADKIAKAEEKLARAREDSTTSAGKANDKVAKAEEKLARVKEDLAEKGVADEEKRLENIEKATEAVAKAEAELAGARKESAAALDMTIGDVFPQLSGQLEGLSAQVAGFIPQAGAAGPALAQVAGGLSSMAVLAGPAGMSIGVLVQGVQVVISLAQTLDKLFKEMVGKVTAYRAAQLQVFDDYLSNVAELNSMVREQKAHVVDLAAQWVDAVARVSDAIRAVGRAGAGVLAANLEGAKGVADIQKRMADLMKGQSSGGGGGTPDEWLDVHDMGVMWDSHADKLTATTRVKKPGDSGGGSVQSAITNAAQELAALQVELAAAQINQQVLIRQAQADLIEAQYNQIQAVRDLYYLEQQRNLAWARLLQLQEIQVQFGMSEQQARIAQAINELKVKNIQADATLMDIGNRIGRALDFDGDGKIFGLFTNVGSASVQAAESMKAANEKQIALYEKLMVKYGGSVQSSPDEARTAELAARLIAKGEDAAAEMMIAGSTLGDAGRALDFANLTSTLNQIDQSNLDLGRELENLSLNIEKQNQLMPIQEEIYKLENQRDALKYQAEALRTESEAVHDAAIALAEYHAGEAERARQKQTISISLPGSGQVVDADQVFGMLRQLENGLDGVRFDVNRLQSASKPGAMAVLATRS